MIYDAEEEVVSCHIFRGKIPIVFNRAFSRVYIGGEESSSGGSKKLFLPLRSPVGSVSRRR
ncbi:MAG: hypothetical protein DRQ24_05550 [Candidatus Latescibacterota bacterium]|nr:MAG: hypothetical protein DRQ24_05550 [Candidatus Latescibacterota bacterium]